MPSKKKSNTDESPELKSSSEDSSLVSTPVPPTYSNAITELVDQEELSQTIRHPVHVRVSVRQGESVEQMLRRFNFAVTKTEIIKRLKDKQYYEKPSKAKQREAKEAKANRKAMRSYDK